MKNNEWQADYFSDLVNQGLNSILKLAIGDLMTFTPPRRNTLIAIAILTITLNACYLPGLLINGSQPVSRSTATRSEPTATALQHPATLSPTSTATITMTPTPTATLSPAPTATPAYSPRLIAYFYGQNRSNQVDEIPLGSLTDVLYAFIGISNDGTCRILDPALDGTNFQRLKQMKAQFPAVHMLISIGGYGGSARFSDVAVSQDARSRFVASCVALMRDHGMDGIDVDWEYPVAGGLAGNSHRPDDTQNFTALMGEFRRQLDRQGQADGQAYLLSLAAPAGPTEIPHFDLAQLSPLVDWITLMAYDFTTGSSPITNFNAPLYPVPGEPGNHSRNADAAVQAYLAAGVPPAKIVLGVPFYVRAWRGVPAGEDGLYQANAGPYRDPRAPAGTWGEGGEIGYRELKKYYLDTWQRFWQDQAQVPWLYNAENQVWVTYDDPQSLAAKANYARARGLGGVSIWQISSDDQDHSLVKAITAHLFP